MTNIFQGLITAVITPFKVNKLDLDSLEKILNYQMAANVDAVMVSGSTGEGGSLTKEEYQLLIKTTLAVIDKKLPVIVGCHSVSTEFAVEIAKTVNTLSVDGIMCTTPAYVRPTQAGLYQHFEAIHSATNIPIMLYTVPSRTGIDFKDETILELAKLPRIMALKDSADDIERPLRISAINKNFHMLADDLYALAWNAHGGKGCVSVAANLVPKLCKQLQIEWKKSDAKKSLEIQQKLLPLYMALFCESNPIPVKYGAKLLGLCNGELRLPLTEASEVTKDKISKVINSLHE